MSAPCPAPLRSLQRNQLYEELFALSPDGILLIDAETQQTIEFNDTACRQLGYTREEFLGLRITDYEADMTPEEVGARVQAALRDGTVDFDTQQRTKTGEIRHVHVWAKPFDLDGRLLFHTIFHDSTDQKQAEQSLKDSEAKFRALFETAQDAIFLMDAGVIVDCNPHAERLFACRKTDIIGRSPLDFSQSAQSDGRSSSEKAAEAIHATLAGQPQFLKWQAVRHDGTPFDAELRLNAVAIGTSLQLQAVVCDITERTKAADAVRMSEQSLAQSQRIAHLGSWTLDLETNALTWSDELYRIYGVSPDVFVPTVDTLLPLIHVDDRSAMRSWIDTATSGKRPRPFQFRVVRPDGTIRVIEGDGERHIDANGKPVRLVGTGLDITERRQVETALRLQAAALYAAADAIIITDRAGVIEWVNPAFTQLSGYTAEEALGKNSRDLVKSGTQAPAFYKELWETVLAGRTWHGEMVNRRKDGSRYTEDESVTPILDASGAITHFVAIKADMTEHLKLEAQYRQAQKMESVGQLASGIAHDFNNLLTVINGMSELVLTQIGQDDPVRADVQEIARAGERAAGLTRQLLAFSRQQILAPRVMNVNTVVADLEGLLRRLLGEDIDLVVVSTPGVGHVHADLGQLEQVITNLAVNARDAMPQGGRLTIETQSVTIDETHVRSHGEAVAPGPYVRLAVSDSGGGMDEATRARIFEPFFTTKGPGKGTGLGLSTVWGIVTQSHGFVSVYSEVGRGTSVQVFLPQVAEATAVDAAAPTLAPRFGTETILLAEDNAGLRKLATRLLEPAGYTVLGAATGEEALQLLAQHEAPVHLLLSDVVMPGMSGRLLAEQVAQTRPGMKVLYMSGYTSDTVVRHGVLDATMPFLDKPFTAVSLLGKVRDVLDS